MPNESAHKQVSYADTLFASARFQEIAQGFEKSCGLKLHAYNLKSVPLTAPFVPPAYCETLQAGLDCPLYFDASYHVLAAPEARSTCAGLGHVVIPVMDNAGKQIANLVSDSCRFGPIDMEDLTEKAFKLKVFPDDLIAQADAVPLVPRDRALMAAQVLFAGIHDIAGGSGSQARVLSLITHHVASAESEDVPDAILLAALEYTGADWGYVALLDEGEGILAESASLESDHPLLPVLTGIGKWVTSTSEKVQVPSIAESSWSTHLAGGTPLGGGLVATPLKANDRVYGALVVGGGATGGAEVAAWSTALDFVADTGADALFIARRLVATGGGAMVDGSGAYNLRFLAELLEKEISRSGRHHRDLSLVMFHLATYAEWRSGLGRAAAEEALLQVVQVIRAKTRKINTLARVGDSDFCLVLPEADRQVAERVAQDLQNSAQAGSYHVQVNGGRKVLKATVETRTVSNPLALDAVLQEIVPGPE